MVMSAGIISFLTSFACFTTASLQFMQALKKLSFKHSIFMFTIFCVLNLHAYLLYRWIDTPLGQNLSVTHVFSLVCWLITLIIFFISFIKPIKNLLIFILPVSACSILLSHFIPGNLFIRTAQNPSSMVHILLSIFTFSLVGIAALQAALLYLQNTLLRTSSNARLIKILPPLETMEAFLFHIIGFGFLLLSTSLLSTFLFFEAFFFTHHLQKIILSILAWALFGFLFVAHHRSGLRGLKAIQWTLLAVILLMCAYLAEKFSTLIFWN